MRRVQKQKMINTQLKQARQKLGLTQKKMAEAMGIGTRKWERWEGGERRERNLRNLVDRPSLCRYS